jgi:hypothetical protein
MNRTEQASRVKAVCAYLEGIGHPISTVQGYEVLARSLGFKNKHVLAAEGKKPAQAGNETSALAVPQSIEVDGVRVRVMSLHDKPLTITEMQALDWSFDIIVPVPLESISDIEVHNDYVSEFITSEAAAMEGIAYEHVPTVQYGKGYVAERVRASISDPGAFFEEVARAEEEAQYRDLTELANRIKENVDVIVVEGGKPAAMVIGPVHAQPQKLLLDYGRTEGLNNDEVNVFGSSLVFEAKPLKGEALQTSFAVALKDLKYAHRAEPDTWVLSIGSRPVSLVIRG